jgi:zona occludens toxin
MATSIHHGAPGSFKSFTLVQRFGIDALKEGRTIVTNIRGFKHIDEIKLLFPKIVFPDTANIIYVTSETALGRLLMGGFFHWVPFRALILIDEAQRIYPKRASFKLESLDKYICPEGFTPEQLPTTAEFPKGIPRPEDITNAFDMQRHFQWDIYLSTPNIVKIQAPIREVAQTAYFHKSLSGKLPFLFKDTWYEFQHDPANTGHLKTNWIGTPHKYKADSRCFKCYQSTATGEHTVSKADKNILSDNGVRFKLACIVLSILLGFFFMFRFVSAHKAIALDPVANPELNQENSADSVAVHLENTKTGVFPVVHDDSNNDVNQQGSNVVNQLGLKFWLLHLMICMILITLEWRLLFNLKSV